MHRVTLFRSMLPALARAAVLALLASPVTVSASALHASCPAARHHCDQAAHIIACCCVDGTEATRPAGPVVAAIRVLPPASSGSTALRTPAVIPAPQPKRWSTGPDRALPDGLTITLANLRV
jgi:hypothetical protein